MEGPSAPTDRPTPVMRLVLGLLTAATTFVTAGPVILILGTLLACSLFAGAAILLAHTGALEPVTFASAHGVGLAGLLVFFITALGYRLIRRDAKGLLGAVSRHPVTSTIIALPALSLLVVAVEWDRGGLPEISGALVLDDLYFFSVGAIVLMVTIAALFARGVYRWAAARRYRAGLITGAQAMVLALVVVGVQLTARLLGSSPSAAPTPDNAALSDWRSDVRAATLAPSGVEAERLLLAGVDALLEPASHRRAAPAAAAAPPSPDDEIRACLQELSVEIDQVQRNVGYRFRLSESDAYDIVRDALLNVCSAHTRKRYARLGAVLQTAADRRALTWARRRARQCEIDDEWPTCAPAQDDLLRFQQEDQILDAAICSEPPVTQEIIRLRVYQELSFAEIGARLGLTADDARFRFNNAVRRMQKRVVNTCGL